ncbi:hypothetical protein ACWGB8_05415 [Kitasatospora sp. NPDC054939]
MNEFASPRPGDVVHDFRARRTGVVMDRIAGLLYLRRPAGGVEWTARPEHTGRPPEDAEPNHRPS